MKALLTLLGILLGSGAYADCETKIRSGSELLLPGDFPEEFNHLLLLVGKRESGLNSEVELGTSGEVGPWQILPSTAKPYLQAGELLRDPKTNARIAAQYLTDLLELTDGDYLQAIAAYNYGPRAIERLRTGRPLPKITANYLVWVIERAKEYNCEALLNRFFTGPTEQPVVGPGIQSTPR